MKNKTQLFHLYTFRFFLVCRTFFYSSACIRSAKKKFMHLPESHTIWI